MAFLKILMCFITVCLMVLAGTNAEQRDGKTLIYEFFNLVRLNPMSRLMIGVQLAFPISVFMPDLGNWGLRSRSIHNVKDDPWSIQPDQSAFSTCRSTGISTVDYLNLMQIHEESCQELFICEMSSDPNAFMPISEIVLKSLAFNKKLMKYPYFSDMINTTDYKLFQAAQVGVDVYQECQHRYWKCPVDATSLINMDLLKGWQVLSKVLDIRFVAETEESLEDDW